MNGVLFLVLITILSLVSSLFTEAVKNACKNANKTYSANLIALINGLVIGAGGVIAAYLLLGIAFTAGNIACIPLMGLAVWMGSMVGYDKVIQLVSQVLASKGDVEEAEEPVEE